MPGYKASGLEACQAISNPQTLRSTNNTLGSDGFSRICNDFPLPSPTSSILFTPLHHLLHHFVLFWLSLIEIAWLQPTNKAWSARSIRASASSRQTAAPRQRRRKMQAAQVSKLELKSFPTSLRQSLLVVPWALEIVRTSTLSISNPFPIYSYFLSFLVSMNIHELRA